MMIDRVRIRNSLARIMLLGKNKKERILACKLWMYSCLSSSFVICDIHLIEILSDGCCLLDDMIPLRLILNSLFKWKIYVRSVYVLFFYYKSHVLKKIQRLSQSDLQIVFLIHVGWSKKIKNSDLRLSTRIFWNCPKKLWKPSEQAIKHEF